MPQHRVKLIVNPNADLGRAWRAASDLRPIVEEYGGADWSGTVYPTHATELAHQAAQDGYELVIAAGGDGTVHEVVNGLMRVPQEKRPRLGVIPLGSGNDFSHAINVSPSPPDAMRQALTGRPRRVDLGVLRDDRGREEYWDNAVGIGFDTTVTIRAHKLTYLHGFLIFLVAVMQTIILNHEAPQISMDTDLEDIHKEMMLLAFCNGDREGGGFHIAPEARPDDGLLHYVYIERVSRPMMLRLLPEVMKGTHARFRQVKVGTLCKAELKSDRPLLIHSDGEIIAGFGVDIRRLQVEIIPAAIEVVA